MIIIIIKNSLLTPVEWGRFTGSENVTKAGAKIILIMKKVNGGI